MKNLILLFALFLTGCLGGGGGGGGSPAPTIAPIDQVPPSLEEPQTPEDPVAPAPEETEDEEPAPTPTPIPTPTPTPPPVVQTFTVSYYSVSRTEAPYGAYPAKTYTATGFCAEYNGKAYCWDDGIKTVTIPGLGAKTYTYWGLKERTGGSNPFEPCFGSCTTDFMASPRAMVGNLLVNVTQAKVDDVLGYGSATQVTCSENAGIVDCGSFQLEVAP